MDTVKVFQEPYFFTILFLTFIAAVAIGYLFFKVFNSLPKKTSNSENIVVRKNPNSVLKGDFNRNIQFNTNKMNNKKAQKDMMEESDGEETKFLKNDEKVEECDSEENSNDVFINREDVKLIPSEDKLTDIEENQLANDICINDIGDQNEKFDIFSKMGELHGKLATAKTRIEARNFQKSLTEEEREEEENIKEKQLKEIFDMLQSQEDKFGIHSKSELEEQFKFYAL